MYDGAKQLAIGSVLDAQIWSGTRKREFVFAFQLYRNVVGKLGPTGQQVSAFAPHCPAQGAGNILILKAKRIALIIPVTFGALPVRKLPSDAVVAQVLLGTIIATQLGKIEGLALGQLRK